MSAPTMPRGPATISPEQKKSGGRSRWRAQTIFESGRTHPVTPVRFVQMQKVIAEIAEKQRRNAPLVPELKAVQAEAISADE
jgi:hypothetical protein